MSLSSSTTTITTTTSSLTPQIHPEFSHPSPNEIYQIQKDLLHRPIKITCIHSIKNNNNRQVVEYILLGNDLGQVLIYHHYKLILIVKIDTHPILNILSNQLSSSTTSDITNTTNDDDDGGGGDENQLSDDVISNNQSSFDIYISTSNFIKIYKFEDLINNSEKNIILSPNLYRDENNNGNVINCINLVHGNLLIGFDNGYLYKVDQDLNLIKSITVSVDKSIGSGSIGSIYNINLINSSKIFVTCSDSRIKIFNLDLLFENEYYPFFNKITSTTTTGTTAGGGNITIDSVSVDEYNNWLIHSSRDCNYLTLFSIRDVTKPVRIIMSGKCQHVKFINQFIIAASNHFINIWNMDGTLKFKIDVKFIVHDFIQISENEIVICHSSDQLQVLNLTDYLK